MDSWPLTHPTLRRDPLKSHGGRPSQSLFAPLARHRPMVVMVDEHLLRAATPESKVQYLLELLADSSIEAFLYSDDGPPARTLRQINLENGVEAPMGWVEIRPGEEDRLRVVAWVKERKPTERDVTD